MKLKICAIGIALCCIFFCSFAQESNSSKPPIDSAAIANWVDLRESEPSISSDGKFFMYTIDNLPVRSKTLVIQSTQNNWKKVFAGANSGIFSFDSRHAIFLSTDTLFFVSLGKDKFQFITGVSSFTYPVERLWNTNAGTEKLIAYKLRQNDELVIKDLVNDKQFSIDNVSGFLLHENDRVMLVKKLNKDLGVETLEWVDIGTKKEKVIWSNADNKNLNLKTYQFDIPGNQAVFLTTDKTNNANNTIWYYREGMQTARVKVSHSTPGIQPGMIVSNAALTFNRTGNYIFFKVTSKPEQIKKPLPDAVQVDVWNYKDLVMQPLQTYFKNHNEKIPWTYIMTEFTSCIAIDDNQATQLENDSEKITANFSGDNDFVITVKRENTGDKIWLREQETKFYLTSLSGKAYKYLRTSDPINNPYMWLSPNKKFLVYFDSELKQYISYDIANGITKNISQHIPVDLTNEVITTFDPNIIPAGIAGWFDDGNLLIYDNYDIWMLDPSGINQPKNITNAYGRANNIKFDLIYRVNDLRNEQHIYSIKKPLLLTAFYLDTKQNGFFKVGLNKKSDPELLSLHSCLIYATNNQTSGVGLLCGKIKAANADVWIVKKQAFNNAPNFYTTTDFKSFKQLTDIQPQKKYRWATTELLTWKMPDGKPCQGILYKPEDFDSSKKYPVIVYYYEKLSAELHQFLQPDLTGGGLNIPWFVSRGYLVFTPDIHYIINHVSESVVNSVIPGIHELLKFSYVDSSAIGIQGQSFGGYETNVLVTESNLFAAAAEGAGASDLISQYGSLLPTDRNDGSGVFHQEKGGQYRLNTTLWEDPQAYIDNSPIFKADKVTTPLLIRHNKGDQAVPWGQAVEFFIALRRLDKPVWMLQYDGEGHGNNSKKTQMDYTIRLTQFFDHYLKGAPAPRWLTQGIPATLKGVISGYNFDPSGNCGKDCKVCKMWNEKMKKDSSGTMLEIRERTKSEHWIADGGEK